MLIIFAAVLVKRGFDHNLSNKSKNYRRKYEQICWIVKHILPPFKVRQAIIPITQIGSSLALPLVFIGMLIGALQWLIPVGIFLYTGVVLFQAVTLPVEFNASRRALKTLDEKACCCTLK